MPILLGKVRKYKMTLIMLVSTSYTKLKFALEGIEFASGCTFYGVPISKRSYNSRVSIGHSCCFRSHVKSNLIGIQQSCILATHRENATLEIGNDCGFSGTVIGASESIIIGDRVLCGANTLITDFDWHPSSPQLRHEPNSSNSAPVVIKDNAWLGYGVVVLKGVTIGENSIITANSVVVSDIPANVIAGGNPAKVIKEISS
ncbi:MAG: acyltransferase [Flavobacteriales bacterium]|nr:acyltransferase [Flavobacteriales bacterium]